MVSFTKMEEYGLSRRIETLIEAWQEVLDKQGQLDRFRQDPGPPEPPSEFDSVGGLIEFVRKRESYERDLAGFATRLQNAERDFAEHEDWFVALLPEGVPLVYEYQSYGTASAGKRYKIVRAPSDEGPRVDIEELGAQV